MATIRRLVALNLALGMLTIAIATLARASRDAARFGFAGWSGSGKTTLIEQLIPRLVARGLTVSLVKHAHHEFDIDQPGKDSFRTAWRAAPRSS
jgi:putative ribosome biogenesis GTPase RsgA